MSSLPISSRLIFMDAGQGDATLIIRPDGQRILIDCGAVFNKGLVSKPIEAILNDSGVYAHGLLALIITHPDKDHYSLVTSLLLDKKVSIGHLYFGGSAAHYKTDNLGKWLANPAPAKAHDLGSPHLCADADPILSCAGMDVRIVAANVGGKDDEKAKNLNSVVVFVTLTTGKKTTFMLMGDSFKETEKWIMNWDGNDKNPKKGALAAVLAQSKGNALKVGHHGSDTSTSDEWLKFTNTTAAFVSSDTQIFNGTSTAVDSVMNRVLPLCVDGGAGNNHSYLQYNTTSQEHEEKATTRWLYTTLVKKIDTGKVDAKGRKLFKADGLPWYYTIFTDSSHGVGPGTGQSFETADYDD